MKNFIENLDESSTEGSVLAGDPGYSHPARHRGNRKILLVLSGTEADDKSLNYALSFAFRNHNSIEVLSFMPQEKTLAVLKNGLEKTAHATGSIPVKKAAGCIKSALIEYAGDRHDIELVIIDSEAALETECTGNEKKLQEMLMGLQCPLVIVSKLKSI